MGLGFFYILSENSGKFKWSKQSNKVDIQPQHWTSTQACSFLTPVNFLFTHFFHLSWINSSGLFSTTGSNDNYPLIHTQWLVNSNKVIPATQAHECRLKTNRSQLSSLFPSPGEEMPWGHILAVADTTLDSIVRNLVLAPKILNTAQPLVQLFHLKSLKQKGNLETKNNPHNRFVTCSHTCSHATNVVFIYHTWTGQKITEPRASSPPPSHLEVVLRAVRPMLFWRQIKGTRRLHLSPFLRCCIHVATCLCA